MLGVPILLAAEAAEEGSRSFGLNLNFLETNFFNILIVVGILFYFLRGYLKRVLGERRSEIETSIQEVEQRAREAEQELAVAKQNLTQAQAQAQQILSEARQNAERVRARILAQAETDIAQVSEGADKDLQNERQRILTQVRLKVVQDSLARVQQRLPQELTDDTQRQLLDQSIRLLD
ncbi:MAG: F0F1 ATP synthase subunit B [Gemmatimonadaceae bacterium]|nr:F0F1 ATP synthase subunit B [Gloeobacterales cyanobacterium ES-bin-141]